MLSKLISFKIKSFLCSTLWNSLYGIGKMSSLSFIEFPMIYSRLGAIFGDSNYKEACLGELDFFDHLFLKYKNWVNFLLEEV